MRRYRKRIVVTGVALLALAVVLIDHSIDKANHASKAIKVVAVVPVERSDLSRTIDLTAELRPWQEIDIHAKVAGYLKNITVDIGDNVKEGDIIAKLDLPEQQQDEAKAEADYEVAKLDFDRINEVIRRQPGLLAQEEVDKARGAYEEAKAAYDRSRILADYAIIRAPFSGTITKRSVDPGALVQAGTASDTQALPLVHLAQMDRLRLDFPVPESSVASVKPGMPVEVKLSGTGETISTQIARISDKVDPATRTMDAEVDLDNPDMHLKPGMYASATVGLETKKNVLAVPIQAVATGDKPNVWRVNANKVVEEVPVSIGIQTPNKVELVSGVNEGDLLVYGSRGNTAPGTQVNPHLIKTDGQ